MTSSPQPAQPAVVSERPGLPKSHAAGRRTTVAVATVAVVVVVVVVAYMATAGFGAHRASRPNVLIQQGTYYSLPGGQFNAVAFITPGGGTVAGTMWDTWGINVYLMTPGEVVSLATKGVVEGYTWTSGHIDNLTTTDLSVPVTAGSWDLVFLNTDNPSVNPVYTNTTIVSFYTEVTLNGS